MYPGTSRRFGTAAFWIVLAGGAAATNARAATPSESAAAQALFDKARQLMAAGNYAQACPKLEESQHLDPGTGTLLNLGVCYEHIGRIAAAWAKFLEAEASARSSGSVERAATAHERAAALAPRLAKLVINVSARQVPGLQVQRDGEVVGPAQWGVAIPVDSGDHAIIASAPSRKSWQTKVAVQKEGTVLTVSVPDLESESASPAAGGSAPANPSANEPRDSAAAGADVGSEGPRPNGLRMASFAAMGVGVVGLGVGTVFGLQSISKRKQADDLCPDPNHCQLALASQVNPLDDDARNAKTIATIGLVGGGVLAVTGVTLFLLSRNVEEHTAAAPQDLTVRPWLGVAAAGVSGTF